ncbi:hypothetical protein B2G71_10110 [Novosphingobium sp. PC22D]|uniref:hypothetical protein n=1 Tax=Novosphingobium sp. PC22D TaxID=1962403 RepID=UPI000BEF8595|nr:hypothetical protein [Novosphingobium sp. PC22D]PEQ12657.1 hypothetical protein B2G71_10110 [Novosphingobium sp. PC22D]
MNLTRDRLHSIGWVSVLAICGAMTLGLGLHVNAVKSEVYRSEQKVVGLRRDIDMLEVEFQTRSNQHQLKTINDLEFGYSAPRADQYIEGERQLASLGVPRAPDAPQPILMAKAIRQDEGSGTVVAMMSPVGGKIEKSGAGEEAAHSGEAETLRKDAARLGERLARVELAGAPSEQ